MRLLRETKSNLEMTSGFHFDFSTELSITPLINPPRARTEQTQGFTPPQTLRNLCSKAQLVGYITSLAATAQRTVGAHGDTGRRKIAVGAEQCGRGGAARPQGQRARLQRSEEISLACLYVC